MPTTKETKAAEFFKKGHELLEQDDNWSGALKAFVEAFNAHPGIARETSLIENWGECMQAALLCSEYWTPRLLPTDNQFAEITEEAFKHLREDRFPEALAAYEQALKLLPTGDREKCEAACYSGQAVACFGILVTEKPDDADTEELVEKALRAQMAAVLLHPKVNLFMKMRPPRKW